MADFFGMADFSPQKKKASGDALDASVLSFRDIVDDPDIDCDGSNLLKLAAGFMRAIDERRFIPHFNSIIISFIPCWKLTGPIKASYWTRSTRITSDTEHVFGIVIIAKTASLATNRYSRDTNLGGKLLMRSMTDFIIDGTIDQSSKGYEYANGKGYTGGSINSGPKLSNSNNEGGGGPGSSAGYGTKGGGIYGGGVYGDELLSTLHLGSGGGVDRSGHYAGEGGGAVKLEAYHMRLNGIIKANGGGGNCCGSGSGGSIHIIAKSVEMGNSAKISAVGGHSDGHVSGVGRIRIESTIVSGLNRLNVNPKPYVDADC